jgi:hypothetical protein
VIAVSGSNWAEKVKFGWANLVQRNPVQKAACINTLVVPTIGPSAKNNIVPGRITSKLALRQFSGDQPRFFATVAKILAQKKTLAPTLQIRAQIKPSRLANEKVGMNNARIPKQAP